MIKREVAAVVDETGERLICFDMTGASDRSVERRVETLMNRFDITAVTVYDTADGPLPPDKSGEKS